jgi:hypothetical protein
VDKFSSDVASIIIASFASFDLILVYRFSENSNINEFTEEIVNILNLTKTALFNLGFIQLVNSPTHVLGGIILKSKCVISD